MELLAKLRGELQQPQATINVQVLAPVILGALGDFPEARLAVAARLQELDVNTASDGLNGEGNQTSEAVSGGRLVALSTPWGRKGWFYHEWGHSDYWKKTKITAHQCPRLTEEILEQERESMGEWWYRQEYLIAGRGRLGLTVT